MSNTRPPLLIVSHRSAVMPVNKLRFNKKSYTAHKENKQNNKHPVQQYPIINTLFKMRKKFISEFKLVMGKDKQIMVTQWFKPLANRWRLLLIGILR